MAETFHRDTIHLQLASDNNKESGLSLVETLVAVALLGIFAVAVGEVLVNYNSGTLKLKHIGEREDLKRYIRSQASCVKTVESNETLCNKGGYVNLLDASSNVLVKENFNSFVTKVGKHNALRAYCSAEGDLFSIRVQNALIKENAQSVKKETLMKDPLTGEPLDWQDLFAVNPIVCRNWAQVTAPFAVPGTSNIYLSGSMASSLTYPFKKGYLTDNASNAYPVQAVFTDPQVFSAGSEMRLAVGGSISHGGGTGFSTADGGGDTSHILGAVLGKSDIVAPVNSMVGVFLTNVDPAGSPPPASLNFSGAGKNYQSISPQIGQVFFIGDGRDSSDNVQAIVVPANATRLFLGVMDLGQWNNNAGGLFGTVFWRPKP